MKYLRKTLKTGIFAGILAIFLCTNERCATVGRPTGGDKDSIPPEIVSADPELNSINFDARRVEIEFNEYVKLNNVNKQLIISPPIEKNPVIWIRGKGIYFEVDKEELKDSITYVYNFGDAIVDVNESNPYTNFSYVFSTGPNIDTMGIYGTIKDAYNLSVPKEPFWIMLYNQLEDSVPLKEKPLYVTRTNKDGFYSLDHIKPGTYRLFALYEERQNLVYDQKNELISFSDSLIRISPEIFEHIEFQDSLVHDSLAYDSTKVDSLNFHDQKTKYYLEHNLLTFREKSTDTLQYLKSWDYVDNKMVYFSFNQPLTDSFHYKLLNFQDLRDWYVLELSAEKDSVNFWITDTTILAMDTLHFVMNYLEHDSSLNLVMKSDTIMFRKGRTVGGGDKKRRNQKGDKGEEKSSNYLKLSFKPSNNQMYNPFDSLIISTKTPFLKIDTSKIVFEKIVDTLYFRSPYAIIKDTIHLNQYIIKSEFIEGSRFRISIFDSAFTDIYNVVNDTIFYNFLTKRYGQYGKLMLSLSGIKDQVILLLMDSKEKILREQIVEKDGEILYEYLNPGDYKLKIIYDSNKNGKWDTGNYMKNILPEKVQYFGNTLKIRENWDHAEKWDITSTEENIKN